MPQHTVPKTNESKADFIDRCREGGETTAACDILWDDRPTPRFAKIGIGSIAGLSFQSAEGEGLFKKDLISVGVYSHPIDGWEMDVTAERIDKWVASFSRMRENGIDVEVVVDHKQNAESVVGYLVDMFREGDTLFGIHKMTSERGVELANTVKNVSVLIEPDFVDGHGVNYGESITHSAIVQQPVVPDQKEFTPVSLSFNLTEDKTVNILTPKLSKLPGADEMKKLSALLKEAIKSAKTDENTEEKILSAIAKEAKLEVETVKEIISGDLVFPAESDVAAFSSVLKIEADDVTAAVAADAKGADAELSKSLFKSRDLEHKVARMEASIADPDDKDGDDGDKEGDKEGDGDGEGDDKKASLDVDKDTLDEIRDTRDDELELLVEKGHITPACKKDIAASLLGTSEKPNAYALSRKGNGGSSSIARSVIKALAKNDPVELGKKTGLQNGKTLSRLDPDKKGDSTPDEDKAYQEKRSKEIIANIPAM